MADADSMQQDAAFIPDEKVWFDDGNLVIRAGSGVGGSPPTHGFKCHKSVLRLSSSVFAGLFTLPSSGNDKVDGLDCVDLTDKWEDVRDLLWTLYGFDLPLEKPRVGTASHIGGVFRLANKYDMPEIVARMQGVLEREWPDDFDDWMDLEATRNTSMTRTIKALDYDVDVVSVDHYWPDPAPVFRLARETRTPSLFRASLYALCRANLTPYRSGLPYAHEPSPGQPIFSADIHALVPEDMWFITIAREKVYNRAWAAFNTYLPRVIHLRMTVDHTTVAPGCLSNEPTLQRNTYPCSPLLDQWLQQQLYARGELIMKNPVWELTKLQESLAGKGFNLPDAKVCSGCREWLTGHLNTQARLFWEWLPTAFQLDTLSPE